MNSSLQKEGVLRTEQGDKVFVKAGSDIGVSDLSEEKATKLDKSLRHASIPAFSTPATYEPWLHNIPCAYIFTELDGAIPFAVQQMFASQIGPDATTFSLKADHSPFLSVPDQVLDAVSKCSAIVQSKKGV